MTSAPLPAAQPVARWNTLQVLKTLRVVLPALAVLLLGLILVAVDVHRGAMQVVAKDAGPSIIDAQHIRAAMAGMDADAADQLLAPVGAATAAAARYDHHRVEADEQLVAAARNMTYASEQAPIEALQVNGGTYARLVQEAGDLAEAGQHERSLRSYRAAALLVDGTLLPAADELDRANDVVLESTYGGESEHSFWSRMFVLLAGGLTLGFLVGAQVFLVRRTRRVIQPLLLLATLATLGLTAYTFAGMGAEERELKVAKENAFSSVHTLWRARSVAFAARGDESRALLDPAQQSAAYAAFAAATDALAHFPETPPAEEVLAAAGRGEATPGFSGLLAEELQHASFHGERDAAVRTVEAFERYLAADARVRAAATGGNRQRAVELVTGGRDGDTGVAFDQFDQALGDTLAIDQSAFDHSVAWGRSALKGMEWISTLSAALIAVLMLLGLTPRIREYE